MNRLSNFILFSELILHLQDNNVVLWLNLRENYKMGQVVQRDKVGSLEFGGNILVLPFCLYIVCTLSQLSKIPTAQSLFGLFIIVLVI